MFNSAITDKFMILQFNDVYIFSELNQRSILLLDTYPQQYWITNATYCVRYVTLPTGPHASVGRWKHSWYRRWKANESASIYYRHHSGVQSIRYSASVNTYDDFYITILCLSSWYRLNNYRQTILLIIIIFSY